MNDPILYWYMSYKEQLVKNDPFHKKLFPSDLKWRTKFKAAWKREARKPKKVVGKALFIND